MKAQESSCYWQVVIVASPAITPGVMEDLSGTPELVICCQEEEDEKVNRTHFHLLFRWGIPVSRSTVQRTIKGLLPSLKGSNTYNVTVVKDTHEDVENVKRYICKYKVELPGPVDDYRPIHLVSKIDHVQYYYDFHEAQRAFKTAAAGAAAEKHKKKQNTRDESIAFVIEKIKKELPTATMAYKRLHIVEALMDIYKGKFHMRDMELMVTACEYGVAREQTIQNIFELIHQKLTPRH